MIFRSFSQKKPFFDYKKDFKVFSPKSDKRVCEMALDKINSLNSIVFHVSSLATNMSPKLDYHKCMKYLLLEEKNKPSVSLGPTDYNTKLLFGEISKNTRENITRINTQLENYFQKKESPLGKILLNEFFHLLLLKFLGYNQQESKINSEDIKLFLEQYVPQREEIYLYNVLSLFYLGKEGTFGDKSENDEELVIRLLYYRIKIYLSKTNIEKYRTEYYTLQKTLEEKINLNHSTDISAGKLLKVALILKAVVGNGIYLPEKEKELYLSKFAKIILEVSIQEIIKDAIKQK